MRQRFILSGLLILFCAFMIFSRTRETPTGNAAEVSRTAQLKPAALQTDILLPPDSQQDGVTPTESQTDTASPGDAPASYASSANKNQIPLVRLNDIIFKPATYDEGFVPEVSVNMDFDYLMNNIFLAQSEPGLRTGVLPSDVEAGKLLNADVSLSAGAETVGASTGGSASANGPKVLIFHTHSGEMYSDSLPGDLMEGVAGAGKHLASLLNGKYGIPALHHTARYDTVDGASQISGAYERMEPDIRRVLADNPSVEMVIDLHRDGLAPGTPPMVAVANGKRAAKIMFVNGMCQENVNGTVVPVPWLQNDYVFENLALSFQSQLAANEMYPGFARRIYLKPYRYSLHMLPKSLIVEVGAQNNTKREALNAVEALAEIIAKVVLK